MDHNNLNDETLLHTLCKQATQQNNNPHQALEALAEVIERYVRARGESQCQEKP